MKKSDQNTFLIIIKKVWKNFLDFIWPQFCLDCHKEGQLFCDNCFHHLEPLEPNASPWGKNNAFYFEACYVCLDYQDSTVEKLIKHFKYRYLTSLSDVLVQILARQADKINLPDNTIITNVPLHSRKYRERGFDQTQLLAKKLATTINLPYKPLLVRIKKTKVQAKLTKVERQQNVHSAFALNKKLIQFGDKSTPTILLIDDVATTGATLNEAARVLKDAGFTKIICLVLAKNESLND